MKQIKLPDHLIACSGAMLETVAGRIAKIRGIRADDGDAMEKTEDGPEVEDGGEVRIIQIRGVLMRDCRMWSPWATDTEEVEEMLDEAEADNNVSAIILDFDSPGGTVNGSVELADFVSGIRKPVVSYVAGDCCSAAYMIAAGSDMISIRRTASVASVGVYSAILDVSKMYDRIGVKTELFKAGENKAVGYPGTSITDDQRLVIQADIDRLGDMFRTHVINYRPEVDILMLDGRCVSGELAVSAGFADEIVGGRQGAITSALALAGM